MRNYVTVRATISTRLSSCGYEVRAVEDFSADFFGGALDKAKRWLNGKDELVLDPANEGATVIVLEVVQQKVEREHVRRLYDASKSGLPFVLEHAAEVNGYDRRFAK